MKVDNEAGGLGSEVTTETVAAGGTLIVYAVGYDAYGNYVSDESVTWTATGVCSGNLSPTTGTSTTFTAVTIGDGTITADHLTVTDDTTGTITVIAGALDHFIFATIGDQELNKSFTITITAKDASGNIVTDYTKKGKLTATFDLISVSISPKITTAFSAGVWTGDVTIGVIGTAITITITDVVSGKTGTSESFGVVAAVL